MLVVPRTVVGHRGGRWWVTATTRGEQLPAPVAPVAAPGPRRARARSATPTARGPGRAGCRRVAEAVARITAGELDKVVLARDLDARTERPVDLRWVLDRLADGYPSCWTFSVDGLVGATPELLVRCERGLVTSRVLAGTIRRTGDDDDDLALAASLARSSKDLEEHEYAVRSVADALGRHCAGMNVPEAPFVLHLPNVLHLASDVTGVLPRPEPGGTGPSVLDLVEALHPTAAVCGTPTAVAARAHREVEGMDRGRYAGPVGWVDAHGDGEWGIALRSAGSTPRTPPPAAVRRVRHRRRVRPRRRAGGVRGEAGADAGRPRLRRDGGGPRRARLRCPLEPIGDADRV